jgi:LysM repeat protein
MKQRLFVLATFLLLSWLLAACERPLQPAVDPDPTPVEVVDAPEAPEVAPEVVPVDTPIPAEEVPAEPVEETDPADESPRPEAPQETEPEETAPAEETEVEVEVEEEATTEPETAVEAAPPAAAEAPAVTPATHTVAPGENLYRIGLRYGISWVTLAQLNNLSNPNSIVVGQVLRLSSGNGAAPTPTPSPYVETMHTVRVGENLYRIGRAYGIGWTLIAEANGLVNPNQIYVGQVLKIPVSAPGPTPQFTHVVQRGETLFLISLRYGVSWPVVAQANNITSPYVIYVGQTLVIPGGGN